MQHNGTLFLQEAIWDLFVHGGNQSFPVVFEPTATTERKRERERGVEREKPSEEIRESDPELGVNSRTNIKPSHGGEAAPPHARLPERLWPDPTWLFLFAVSLEVQLFTHKPLLTACF